MTNRNRLPCHIAHWSLWQLHKELLPGIELGTFGLPIRHLIHSTICTSNKTQTHTHNLPDCDSSDCVLVAYCSTTISLIFVFFCLFRSGWIKHSRNGQNKHRKCKFVREKCNGMLQKKMYGSYVLKALVWSYGHDFLYCTMRWNSIDRNIFTTMKLLQRLQYIFLLFQLLPVKMCDKEHTKCFNSDLKIEYYMK